jgi:hypothetical protein
MELQNEAQQACYDRVKQQLAQLFGEEAAPAADGPSFTLRRGSADVHITVAPVGEGAAVAVFAWVATGVTPSEELYRFLLTENASSMFGGFALTEDNTVVYQHTITGESVDKGELRASVRAVADAADNYDDVITSRFGGQTARATGS